MVGKNCEVKNVKNVKRIQAAFASRGNNRLKLANFGDKICTVLKYSIFVADLSLAVFVVLMK